MGAACASPAPAAAVAEKACSPRSAEAPKAPGPAGGPSTSRPLPVVLGGGGPKLSAPPEVARKCSQKSCPGRLQPSLCAAPSKPEEAATQPAPCQRHAPRPERRQLLVPKHARAAARAAQQQRPACCGHRSGMMLKRLMKGRKTDWRRARRAASQICSPSYTCRDFYEDIVVAFPELDLYLAGDMTSGRDGEDEYQRTLGAMFAFFWLMRLHLDGSESFCYGLDSSWRPRCEPRDGSREERDEWALRRAFREETEWAALHELLVGAGLLTEQGAEYGSEASPRVVRRKSFLMDSFARREELAESNITERILGMLVLTAIHDIMKTVPLLPSVSKENAPFRGYQAGEVIGDHDVALAYVLEFHPSALPSFAGLPKEQQQSIKFTQSKMEYNMGWLVQAEAPPGALLRKFRQVVASGQANPRDVAFYFTHWFTDLAGAEPYPQEGCEKFVLKFPRAVLNQFLQSFSIMKSIGLPDTTETRVMEDYLLWRWDNHKPPLGPAPSGAGSMAKIRLVTMAQGDSESVLRGFDRLPPSDREVLGEEMAMTGCQNQAFCREGCGPSNAGPAILVYYAPALMQKAGKQDALGAMRLLAEVYRQARATWPLTAAAADDTVTVRIDALKELTVAQVQAQSGWALAKLSSRDGAVRRVPLRHRGACCAHADERPLRFPGHGEDLVYSQASTGSTTTGPDTPTM